jgi:hypothetical protein
MIELILTGAYRGVPHEVGAWAWTLRREGLEIGAGNGVDRPDRVTSRLSAQAAGLALGLQAAARDWAGEEILVRAAGAGLEGLLRRQPPELPAGLNGWVRKARAAAESLAAVRILPAAPEAFLALDVLVRQLLPADNGRLRLARAALPPPFREGRR